MCNYDDCYSCLSNLVSNIRGCPVHSNVEARCFIENVGERISYDNVLKTGETFWQYSESASLICFIALRGEGVRTPLWATVQHRWNLTYNWHCAHTKINICMRSRVWFSVSCFDRPGKYVLINLMFIDSLVHICMCSYNTKSIKLWKNSTTEGKWEECEVQIISCYWIVVFVMWIVFSMDVRCGGHCYN
jgi:hypothetical protein